MSCPLDSRFSVFKEHEIDDEGFTYKIRGFGGFNRVTITSIHLIGKKCGDLLYYHKQHQKISGSTLKKYLNSRYLEVAIAPYLENEIRGD